MNNERILTKTEFYQVIGYNNTFEVPVDENVISVFISNNAGYLGLISINGQTQNDGLTLISGRSLYIKGLTDQVLSGKITIKILNLTSYNELQQVGVLIKRRIK
jgi:hypothetical protein